MNKSNHEDSSEGIHALIESAAVKKQHELDPAPTKQDYEEVTALMVELFTKNKTKYYQEDQIIPSLKSDVWSQYQSRSINSRKDEVDPRKQIDRVGLEGRDAILRVLKEKQIVNEFDPKNLLMKRNLHNPNLHGEIVLVENYEPDEPSGFFTRFFHTPQYKNAFDSDLPVYRYATRDELYTNKLTQEDDDESSEEEQDDLQSQD